MQKHVTQVAEIIEATRHHDGEGCLTDSRTAATKVIAYILYHFDAVEKISKEPLIIELKTLEE